MHPLNRHDFPTPRLRPSFELLLGLRVLTALPRAQCYRGVCGGWRTLPSEIVNEAQREDWIASDDTLANCDPSLPYVGCPPGGCGDSCCSDLNAHAEDASELITSYICHCANCQCMECLAQDENYGRAGFNGRSAAGEDIFPMYLGLENDDGAGGGHWHGEAASEDVVYSYMAWRYPNIRWAKWRPG